VIGSPSTQLARTIVLAILALTTACSDDPNDPDQSGTGTAVIELIQVDEDAGLMYILSRHFIGLTGTPIVTINGRARLVARHVADTVVATIPASGQDADGDVVVRIGNTTSVSTRVLTWSGTVTSNFSNNGLTSTGTFALKFRGSIPISTRYDLLAFPKDESSLQSWDVGGSNPQVTSRTKSCAGSSMLVRPDINVTGSSFSARMEIYVQGSIKRVWLFGTGAVLGCVLERYSDGSSMTTGAGWPFLGFLTSVGAADWIQGGTAQTGQYTTAWSTFALPIP
jgi:hypothetical protein